jgi:hypothetical protein
MFIRPADKRTWVSGMIIRDVATIRIISHISTGFFFHQGSFNGNQSVNRQIPVEDLMLKSH